MTKYIYYCAACRSTFELEVNEPEACRPESALCQNCGRPGATMAFPAEVMSPPKSECKPGSGC